jgi:hypothetical protein
MKNLRAVLALVVVWCPALGAQSSNASLSGRITNRADGKPVRALVVYRNVATGATSYVLSNAEGLYLFPALLPGKYTIRADAPTLNLQAEERTEVELSVGAKLDLDFSLAPKETAPPAPAATSPLVSPPKPAAATTALRGFYSTVYGVDAAVPDAVLVTLPVALTETLVGSLSTVIDEQKILELPYSGRDVYTLLVLQPGVVSDNATGRGLGLAVNGQRVAGTNFLLDGVDNNDLLITGPSARVSADAVQEYRMTTNNFSAEFGRATAFIANVITRTGSNSLHGTLYEFFNHERLNANSFFNNYYNAGKPPFKLHQYGGTAGGPIRRDRLFYFAAFERFSSVSQTFEQPSQVPLFEFPVYVPSASFVASLGQDTLARKVLTLFPPPKGEPLSFTTAVTALRIRYPLIAKNTLGMGRMDYSAPGGRSRWSGRYAISQNVGEKFLNSVYPGLESDLLLRVQNAVFNYTRNIRASGVNEFKVAYSRSGVGFDRPHPEIPTLKVRDGVTLPGSEASYAYSFADTVWHFVDNFTVQQGKHALIFGADVRKNLSNFLVTTARDGLYVFPSLLHFAFDLPESLTITIDRQTGKPLQPSDYGRDYGQIEWAAFVQDNWKFTRRLTLNLGLRYEYFGVPARRDGPADYNLFYGPGSNRLERLASAQLQRGAPYQRDWNNLAPRLGFAYDLRGNGRSVIRGGYGISFDRIFNAIWQQLSNNSLAYSYLTFDAQGRRLFDYKFPARDGLRPVNPVFGQEITFQVDERLRTPYAQSWFIGWQQQLTPNLVAEANYAGSLGRKLLALDSINRAYSQSGNADNQFRIHPAITDISYRGNQGASNHHSLQASLRQRFTRGLAYQVSYTWGRTRDVQSDPFRNPVESSKNLPVFQRLNDPGLATFPPPHAVFIEQFNSRADYGDSDFAQPHNLVFNVVTRTGVMKRGPLSRAPWLTRDWQFSVLAGFRSGFPYSVRSSGLEDFLNVKFGLLYFNRADQKGSADDAYLDPRKPGPGGFFLLDKSKFADPTNSRLGNSPRNAFRGPGFYNLDVGVSRFFPAPGLGEKAQFQFRAEFFNILNHANLGNPDNAIGSDLFGLSTFGRQGFSGSLPSVSPLNEQPRRVQFGLKFIF